MYSGSSSSRNIYIDGGQIRALKLFILKKKEKEKEIKWSREKGAGQERERKEREGKDMSKAVCGIGKS